VVLVLVLVLVAFVLVLVVVTLIAMVLVLVILLGVVIVAIVPISLDSLRPPSDPLPMPPELGTGHQADRGKASHSEQFLDKNVVPGEQNRTTRVGVDKIGIAAGVGDVVVLGCSMVLMMMDFNPWQSAGSVELIEASLGCVSREFGYLHSKNGNGIRVSLASLASTAAAVSALGAVPVPGVSGRHLKAQADRCSRRLGWL